MNLLLIVNYLPGYGIRCSDIPDDWMTIFTMRSGFDLPILLYDQDERGFEVCNKKRGKERHFTDYL